MKCLIFILLLSFVHSDFLSKQQEDEAEALLYAAQAQGEDRLTALHRLQQLHLYEAKDRYYNTLLLEEARAQGNKKYEGIAMTNRVAYYSRVFDNDSIFYYADQAESFAKENNMDYTFFLAREMVVLRYLGQGHYSIGLKKAEELNTLALEKNDDILSMAALLALANAYQALELYDESIFYTKEALRKGRDSEKYPYDRLHCYLLLLATYQSKGDKENLFLYADSLYTQTEYIKEKYPIYNLSDFELGSKLIWAYYYMDRQQMDKAWECIEDADEMMVNRETHYYPYLSYMQKLRYFFANKDHDKVEEYYKLCNTLCVKYGFENELRNLMRFKADYFDSLGMTDRALESYKELLAHTDSVGLTRYNHEINELRMDYELDKREDQIAFQKERLDLTAKLNISLIVLAVLLLITCVIVFYFLRNIRKINYSLFEKIKDLTIVKMELTEFKEKLQDRLSHSIEKNNTSPEEALFLRVEEHMKNSQPYTALDYTRKDLVSDMNTNEVYLSKAIKKCANLTIHEYLNRWRMEHAKHLLLEDVDLTIETVATDSGFSSTRSFYRLFKEANGMSPAEFRNYVLDSYKPKT